MINTKKQVVLFILIGIIIGILISVIVIKAPDVMKKYENYKNEIKQRNVTESDYAVTIDEYNTKQKTVEISVLPFHDIENFSILISFYDDNNELLFTKTENLWDVEKSLKIIKEISTAENETAGQKIARITIKPLIGTIYYR